MPNVSAPRRRQLLVANSLGSGGQLSDQLLALRWNSSCYPIWGAVERASLNQNQPVPREKLYDPCNCDYDLDCTPAQQPSREKIARADMPGSAGC